MPDVGRAAPNEAHTQSVLFEKDQWTEREARVWCKEHDYYINGMDETENTYRFRQFDPDSDKFRYRMKAVGKGITMVLGFPNSSRSDDGYEIRTFALDEVGIADAASDASPGTAHGYFAKFDEKSVEMPWGFEKIRSGAFRRTLTEDDIRSLVNHDANKVLGRNRSGTLRMREDNRGLAFEVDMPDTSYSRDTAVLLRRGDVTQCSFGFWPLRDHVETEDGKPIRVIDEVRMAEGSIVTFPAYPTTEVGLRSVLQVFGTPAPDTVRDELLAFMAATGPGVQLTPADRIALRALLARIECMLDSGSQTAPPDQEDSDWQMANRRRMLDLACLQAGRRI